MVAARHAVSGTDHPVACHAAMPGPGNRAGMETGDRGVTPLVSFRVKSMAAGCFVTWANGCCVQCRQHRLRQRMK